MTIRTIQYDDILWMLKLRNANAKWFINTNDIDILEHISWFKDNYRHIKNKWYVAEINHKQAGYIRNDAGVIITNWKGNTWYFGGSNENTP